MIRKTSEWVPIISLTTAMVLWASSFIALKLAIQSYDPFFVLFCRMAVASACFVFLIRHCRGNTYQKGDATYILLMTLCEPCLYFVLEAMAIERTTASQAAMVTAMLPLMVALGARIFLQEIVSKKTISGFVVAIIGVCWLSLGGEASEHAPDPFFGNFLEFLAMVFAAGYIIILKRLSARYNPFFLTALQAFVGSLFFLQFLGLRPSALPNGFDAVGVFCIIYLGIFINIGAYGLYNYGISRIPASQASAYVNLIPVLTVVLGWVILGERFTGLQYLASGLVFAGILLSQEKLDRFLHWILVRILPVDVRSRIMRLTGNSVVTARKPAQ
jgi:drug/metabolite transporter (DMT)-like permease